MNVFKIPEGVNEFTVTDKNGKVRHYKKVFGQYEWDETYWIEVFTTQKPVERGAGDDYPIIDLNK